jgi:hypothetical protein
MTCECLCSEWTVNYKFFLQQFMNLLYKWPELMVYRLQLLQKVQENVLLHYCYFCACILFQKGDCAYLNNVCCSCKAVVHITHKVNCIIGAFGACEMLTM